MTIPTKPEPGIGRIRPSGRSGYAGSGGPAIRTRITPRRAGDARKFAALDFHPPSPMTHSKLFGLFCPHLEFVSKASFK